MTRCDCCDLPVESCGKALEQRQRDEAMRERKRLMSQPGARPAGFFGRCGRCDEQYGIGAIIAPPDPGTTGWLGPCCVGTSP